MNGLDRAALLEGLQRLGLTHMAHVAEHRAEEAAGHRIGIRAVPYFVLNGTSTISGAQPPDIFVSALQKAEVDRTEGKGGR